MNGTAQHLRDLVEALDDAFLLTWKNPAPWQKALDAARDHIEQLDNFSREKVTDAV